MADHIRAVSSQHKWIEEKMKILVSAASACGLLVGFILLLLHCQCADAGDLTPGSSVIKKALTYIRTCQHEDGGFGPGGMTEWVIVALAAAGQDPLEWKKNGQSPLDYLKDQIPPDDLFSSIRVTLALTAAHVDPRNFGGIDYVQRIRQHYRNGQFGDPLSLRDDYWAILALASSGEQLAEDVAKAAQFVLDNQNTDGSWSASITGIETCVDNTAAAILALRAAGKEEYSEAILKGFAFLRKYQNQDGGFGYLFMPSNAASDSWALQAYSAAGKNAITESSVQSLFTHLLSLQQLDGSFKWTTDLANSPLLMTAYAIPALLGKSYPFSMSRVEQIVVGVRVEGERNSLLTTQIILDYPRPTPLSALCSAAEQEKISHEIEVLGGALYLKSIGSEADGWQYRVNTRLPMIAASDMSLKSGDDIIWFYDYHGCKSPLNIDVEKYDAWEGETISFHVKHYNDDVEKWETAHDALIVIGNKRYPVTDGSVAIPFDRSGTYRIYAEKEGAIRSDVKNVVIEKYQPISVKVRIEDVCELLWEGEVTYSHLTIKDIRGREINMRRPVLLGALDAASKNGGFRYSIVQTAEGLILVSILGREEDNENGSWWYQVNGQNLFQDVDEYTLNNGDALLLYRSKHPRTSGK